MGERTDEIERHIHETRNELGENIDELQQRVKTTLDWRAQFQQRPWTLISAAFGGGLMVSMLIPRGSPSSRSGPSGPNPYRREGRQIEYGSGQGSWPGFAEKTASTWDNIRAALLTTGVSRLSNFIEELIPGFHDQFHRRQWQASGQVERRQNPRRANGPEGSSESRPPWRRTPGGETDFGPQA